MMEEKKYNRSFAGRLSRWVMLVLLIMMCGLSYLIYTSQKASVVELSASSFHTNMKSTVRFINDVMSDVDVAVSNNLFDIERHLGQPDEMQAIVERIVRQNPRIRSCGISFIDSYYPRKGRWFCPYAWRNDTMQVVTRQLGGAGYDYLDSEWFKEAVASDSVYWSKPFFDGQDAKTPLVAYTHPIHDAQGRLVAVLGADLSLDFMARVLEEQDSIFSEDGSAIRSRDAYFHSYVLSQDGTYITHPDQRRIQKGNFFVHIKDADEPGLAEKIVGEMKDGKVSHDETLKVLKVNRKESYLFYAPVTGTSWILVVSCPTIAIDYFAIILGLALIFVIAFVLLIAFLVTYITVRWTAKPLKSLAETADKVAQGQFDTTLPTIKHRDEICQLRDSFENMQQSLAAYIEELKATTTAKASIENELKIAHDIQMSMLPKTYPAFPNRNDIDIFGMVMPAKAVGGDLYDFFIREEKLFFCIGDVSGKGVPASLVMAVTRSLFRNIAAHTAEPHKMVTDVNELLCDNNETNMFVTLFVGVLDLVTGSLDYCNAGHNMPLLLKDGDVGQLACDPNIPVGVMPGWAFTCQQLQLKTDDLLFLYTDGLNEAEDIDHQQFGMDRVLQTSKTVDGGPQELVEAMASVVRQFVGEAEQSDDLTMFAVQKR
ncbi:MAG: SpoIIE family protein phosphatase [Prevotella sp.]|nr:SpoIIE family protein phosphatase [Prevotella sp.]